MLVLALLHHLRMGGPSWNVLVFFFFFFAFSPSDDACYCVCYPQAANVLSGGLPGGSGLGQGSKLSPGRFCMPCGNVTLRPSILCRVL